jgi:hypothetical protein
MTKYGEISIKEQNLKEESVIQSYDSVLVFAAEAREGTSRAKQILDTKDLKENCEKDERIIQEIGLLRNTVKFSQQESG